MDFDLNQVPSETSCVEVEERIRLLEVVQARSRCRQIRCLPQNPSVGSINDISNRGRGIKRNSSDLVAKALSLDTEVRKVVGDGKGFFDCNVCLGPAKDPVLTCCGHLFCWACFYTLPYMYANAKECPVCEGEVTEATVTPIYGAHTPKSGSDEGVPPRPRAKRIEVVRKKSVNESMYTIPVADVLRRIRIEISGPAGRHVPPPTTDGPRNHRSGLIARALSEVDDVGAEEARNGSSVGFLLESRVADTGAAAAADLTVNESRAYSTLRRRERETRGRRSRMPGL